MEPGEQIRDEIQTHPIILYMKGTKERPACGFSNAVVQLLTFYEAEYTDVNVLLDPQIRIKLSEYSNWPTIPQLFVNGELIGGADIAVELHNRGLLGEVLARAGQEQ